MTTIHPTTDLDTSPASGGAADPTATDTPAADDTLGPAPDAPPDASSAHDDPPGAVDDGDGEGVHGLLTRLPVASLAPHPDNPRGAHLGDLGELVRSVKAQGVLEPLIVLPADDTGVHLVVAGHRRLAAARRAGLPDVAVVVRSFTPAQVIETMLAENGQRADLTVAAEVAAIERLLSLDPRLSPTKLSKRIGRSQAWCRSRMALVVLPVEVRASVDGGDLTIAAASAVASVADLGAAHMTALADQLHGHRWGEEQRMADHYRQRVERETAWQERLAAAREGVHPVYETEPAGTVPLSRLFEDKRDRTRHAKQPCHGLVVRSTAWGTGYDEYPVCTSPRSHHVPRSTAPVGATDRLPDHTAAPPRDDSHVRRQGRKARLAAGAELFARTKGGPKAGALAHTAMLTLITEAGQEPLKYAAVLLGLDPNSHDLAALLAATAAGSAADLARVAGAVAFGHAEERAYWSTSNPSVHGWVSTLTEHGWTPDAWTRTHILDAGRSDASGEPDDQPTTGGHEVDGDDPEPGDDDTHREPEG